MDWMLMPLRRYAEFSGRSRRKEYWMFFLLNVIVYSVAVILLLAGGLGAAFADPTAMAEWDQGDFGPLGWIAIALLLLWILGTLIPQIAVNIRRLHDKNHSGWWYLGMIVLSQIPLIGFLVSIGYLIYMATDGETGPNKYGEDPKNPTSADVFA